MKKSITIFVLSGLICLSIEVTAQSSSISDDYKTPVFGVFPPTSSEIPVVIAINELNFSSDIKLPAISISKANEKPNVSVCYGDSLFEQNAIADKTTESSLKKSDDLTELNKKRQSYTAINKIDIKSDESILKNTSTTPQTFFISEKCRTFYNNGDWYWESFTLYQTTDLVMRFASQYSADAAIFMESQRINFQNNYSFIGWGIFDNQIGYHTVTLAPGSYYLGLRNQTSGTNKVSVELDYVTQLPLYDNCSFYDYYLSGVYNISSGGKFWQSFTVQNGFRYFIDGINSGVDVYFIPENQLTNFINNQTFLYYIDYPQTSCGEGPGFYEIMLPAGIYYMVARNTSLSNHSINYEMQRWINNYTSVEDLSLENKIILYPNPVINELTIEYKDLNFTKNELLSIYNLQGQLLMKQILNESKTVIDISSLLKGVYLLKIKNQEGVVVKRFVKE